MVDDKINTKSKAFIFINENPVKKHKWRWLLNTSERHKSRFEQQVKQTVFLHIIRRHIIQKSLFSKLINKFSLKEQTRENSHKEKKVPMKSWSCQVFKIYYKSSNFKTVQYRCIIRRHDSGKQKSILRCSVNKQ